MLSLVCGKEASPFRVDAFISQFRLGSRIELSSVRILYLLDKVQIVLADLFDLFAHPLRSCRDTASGSCHYVLQLFFAFYTQADLSTWYADDFAKKHEGAAKKAKREICEVRFEGNAVVRQDANSTGIYADAGKPIKAPITLKFDLAQIADVLSVLRTKDTGSVMAFADDAGLVSFLWEDAFASWELYLPTLNSDGSRLQSRRFAPMSAEAGCDNSSSN